MTMKLSALIIEGAKMRPQGFKKYFEKVSGEYCSCALGAAYEALIPELLGRDNHTIVTFAMTLGIPTQTEQLIADLNDDDCITREQIAERLIAEGLDIDIEIPSDSPLYIKEQG